MDTELLLKALSEVIKPEDWADILEKTSPTEPKQEEPKESTPPTKEYVQYVPSQKHVDNNWAPENRLTTEDIASLGKAARKAVDTGVLKPELADMMLPMAIVEGRSENFGVKESNSFYAKPATLKRFLDMGLLVTDAHSAQDGDVVGNVIQRGKQLTTDGNNTGADKAKMMAAILSEKSSLKGVDSVDKAIMKYNGTGKAIEKIDGKEVPADTSVYLNKVREARRMLGLHPTNKHIVELFNKAYNEQ